jgi:hypothetical protein
VVCYGTQGEQGAFCSALSATDRNTSLDRLSWTANFFLQEYNQVLYHCTPSYDKWRDDASG